MGEKVTAVDKEVVLEDVNDPGGPDEMSDRYMSCDCGKYGSDDKCGGCQYEDYIKELQSALALEKSKTAKMRELIEELAASESVGIIAFQAFKFKAKQALAESETRKDEK